MSKNTAYLALRLEGPLQSWGYNSQFSRRRTGLFPTKSAILGICCAAKGVSRGSREEEGMLAQLNSLRFLAITVPRVVFRKDGREKRLPVRRLIDYHTVEGTRKADGTIKDTHLTWRHYLCDASFRVVLAGERGVVEDIGRALKDPVWGVWLGRKACIPTAPVFAGTFDSEKEALNALLGGSSLSECSRQQEVELFEEGTDTLPDQPLCFGGIGASRAFAPRRVVLIEGRERDEWR